MFAIPEEDECSHSDAAVPGRVAPLPQPTAGKVAHPECHDAAAQWLTKWAETFSDLCVHCSCVSDITLEGLEVYLTISSSKSSADFYTEKLIPSLLVSWCHMLVSCAGSTLPFRLWTVKNIKLDGRLPWGGLKMHSSAWSVFQWWMSGLCWAAEQQAGTLCPATEVLNTGW